MRKDQGLFLGVGIVIGLIIGLVFGVVGSKSELFGGTPKPEVPPAAAMRPQQGGGGMPPQMAMDQHINELKERLAKNPKDPQALADLGEIFLQQRMNEQAIAHFDRALSVAPHDAALLVRAANAFQHAGEPRKALEAARAALAADQGNPAIAEQAFTVALHGAGDLPAAEQALAELKRRAPGAMSLAGMQADLDNIKRVLADGDRLKDDAKAQVMAGNFLYDTGHWAESEKHYRRAVELSPRDAGVVTDLGYVIYRQGRFDDALAMFERALAANPQQWQAALNAVIVALEKHDAKSARAWLERLKVLKGDLAELPGLEQNVQQIGG